MKKLLLSVFMIVAVHPGLYAQDLMTGGQNSWLIHSPDDGRTSLYFLPGTNGESWGAAALVLQNDKKVSVGGYTAAYTLDVAGDIGFSGQLHKYVSTAADGNPTLISAQSQHSAGAIPIITLGYNQSFAPDTDMDTKIWSYARNPQEIRGYINIGIARIDIVAPRVSIPGYVGFGTTTPYERVQIGDSIAFHDGGWKGLVFNAYYSDGWRAMNTGPIGRIMWDTHSGALRIFATTANKGEINNEGERLTIMNNGDIGIGITAPSHKLTVNGTIRAKEIVVDTNWADDVFESGYLLPSIRELEKHIEANKRLPGVPSAKEVANEGVSLGESQTMLLHKIEELSLYIIQQHKRIEQLEQKVTQMGANKN